MARANCYMSASFAVNFSMEVPAPDGDEEEVDCQAIYDQCLAGEGPFAPDPDEEEDEDEESCDEQLMDLSECTEVTVADLESCMQAQRAIMEQVFQGLAQGTCADIEAEAMNDEEPSSGSGLSLNMEDIPECADLPDKCPPMALDTEPGDPDALPVIDLEDDDEGAPKPDDEDDAEPGDEDGEPVPLDS